MRLDFGLGQILARQRALVMLCVGMSLGIPSASQNPAAGQTVSVNSPAEVIELGVLSGAPETDPALKYLFDGYVETPVRENAAYHYQRAMRAISEMDRSPARDAYPWEREWLDLSVKQLGQTKVADFIREGEAVYREIEIASRCTYCEWYIDAERGDRLSDYINLNLTDMQESRRLARFLVIKARYHLSLREFDQAAECLRVMYQLGYHVQEQPLIITGLIGAAIHGIADATVQDWITTDGSPNLYWALCSLRQPPVDLTRGLLGEMRLFTKGIQSFDRPETKDWSPEQWIESLATDFQAIYRVSGQEDIEALTGQLMISGMLTRGYPMAKKALLDEGYTGEQLDAMPVAQVVCIHQSLIARRLLHDELKWQFIRNSEGTRRLVEQTNLDSRTMGQLNGSELSLFFVPTLLPAFSQARYAEVRLNRQAAVLKTLEAIRMHVAETGQPPSSLADIQTVPVPTDMNTDKPFEYRLTEKAVEVVWSNWLFPDSPDRIYRWQRP